MSSYGNPSAPPYRGQSQGQGWQQQQQQQQTPSYGQTGGSYNYGDSAPSSYGQQQTNYGQPPPASSYGQQPSAYSSYGQTYPAYGQTPYGQPTSIRSHFPPGTDPEIVRVFEQADTDRSGTIEAKELGKILSADYGDFSPRTVRLMLHLYADNKTDTTRIGPAGFVPLWMAIDQWQTVFERFDRDRSGTIEGNELREALLSLGFNIPPQVLHILVSKYDTTGRGRSIEYDNFIEYVVTPHGLSEKFKEKDQNYTGVATMDYETFMLMVLPFIVA
ncbi:unnamed protein product [Sphagnum troendelagicum]